MPRSANTADMMYGPDGADQSRILVGSRHGKEAAGVGWRLQAGGHPAMFAKSRFTKAEPNGSCRSARDLAREPTGAIRDDSMGVRGWHGFERWGRVRSSECRCISSSAAERLCRRRRIVVPRFLRLQRIRHLPASVRRVGLGQPIFRHEFFRSAAEARYGKRGRRRSAVGTAEGAAAFWGGCALRRTSLDAAWDIV